MRVDILNVIYKIIRQDAYMVGLGPLILSDLLEKQTLVDIIIRIAYHLALFSI